MKDSLIYQDAELSESSLLLAESQANYVTSFDAAVDVFCSQLEYIDRRSENPGASADEMLILTTKAIMNMSVAAEQFEHAVGSDKEALKDARSRLHLKTQHFFSQGFCNRGRAWPQGHAGDYNTIEIIYRNTPVASGVTGYLDRYFLATTLSVAVRERKETLRDLLAEEFKQRQEAKILDLACGSCREIFELATDIERTAATVTCVDFDADALDFGAQRISLTGARDKVSFRKYNVLKMINHQRNVKEFGFQDIIYSVGFFDYLDDELLVRLLSALYSLLSVNGKLIASFKDCRQYKTFDTSWLLDWDGFHQRTEEDMWDLLSRAGIPRTALTTSREKSGVIVFFVAAK